MTILKSIEKASQNMLLKFNKYTNKTTENIQDESMKSIKIYQQMK